MCMPMALKRPIDTCICDKDEESQRCQKRQRKSARTVVFAESNPATIEFEKLDNDAKADVWYSKDDFQLFQLERILNVQCLQRVVTGDKTPIDHNVVCFRGLEPYRSEQRREKFLLRRQNHVASILEEQDRQVAEGVEDPEAFREIVAVASEHALKIAQYQALIDHHEGGLKKSEQKNKVKPTNPPMEDSPVLSLPQQMVAVRAA